MRKLLTNFSVTEKSIFWSFSSEKEEKDASVESIQPNFISLYLHNFSVFSVKLGHFIAHTSCVICNKHSSLTAKIEKQIYTKFDRIDSRNQKKFPRKIKILNMNVCLFAMCVSSTLKKRLNWIFFSHFFASWLSRVQLIQPNLVYSSGSQAFSAREPPSRKIKTCIPSKH